MATLEELLVKIEADTSQLRTEMTSALNATKSSTEKMDKALEEFTKNSGKNLSFLEQSFAQMAGFVGGSAIVGAFNLLKDSAKAAFDELLKGGEAAIAEERSLTRLANSLAINGTYTQAAMKSLKDFTGSMEEQTGIADDVVASNLAVLSSLTKLSSQGLQQAQKAAIDMSAALGIDLESATKLVAKGIDGNTEAFKKYGITIQEGTNKTENFNNVVSKLNAQFGGAAGGVMKTFSGAVTGASNAFGNFTEEIARSVTSNPVVIAALNEITKIFNELTSAAEGSAGALRDGVGEAFLAVLQIIMTGIEITDKFIKTMVGGLQTIDLGVSLVSDSIDGLMNLLSGDKSEGFKQTEDSFNRLQNTIEGDSTLGDLNKKLERVYDASQTAFSTMGKEAAAVGPSIGIATSKVKELTEAEKAHQQVLKDFATGLAGQAEAVAASYAFQAEALKGQLDLEQVTKADYAKQAMEIQLAQFEAENQALNDAFANKLISQQQFQDASTGLTQKHITDNQKMQKSLADLDKASNKERAENFKSTMGTIATLSESGNKELAAIGKAAAITNATIDGYAAVQKALASAPPPFNFALAALVGAATAANVAKIAGVGLASGITEVPRSAGGGNNGDNFPAILKSGERVVDSQTNQDLKAFLANQNGGGGRSVTVNVNIGAGTGITREQAGMIVEGLNDYFTSGGLGFAK